MNILLAIIWIYLNFSSSALTEKSPIVETIYGQVKGVIRLSRNGRKFNAFSGIPYARPPIGDLRFAEPQEPNPWNVTLNATKEPPTCIQRNYLFSSTPWIEGSEDCLYLNVYVPQEKVFDSHTYSETQLPVMVFIHWGAFIAGRSSSKYLGPDYFMDKDVVLVTFNYRLGPFGFLSTTDDEAPGNYGLKDQVATLKWVQANIGNFGGNKNNVVIFGQSAGAGSVHYHLLSSASKGLFHKAISQSGSALAGWAAPLNNIQKQITKMQATFVGCGNFTENSEELISCLRSVPAEEFMRTQDHFKLFNGDPLVIFGSVVEKKSKRNPNPFLTQTPLEYILKGEINDVPWMTGLVKNEGVLRAASLIRPKGVREALNKDFEKILSDVLLIFPLSTKNPQSLYKNVTKFYLGGKEFIDIENPNSIQGLIDLYSDRAFVYPLYQSILLHARKQFKPIYLYSFEYVGLETYANLFAGTTEIVDHDWGTCHCDDLIYLFRSPYLINELENRWDIYLSKQLVNVWTDFAKYGDPNTPYNFIIDYLQWKPLDINTTNLNCVNHAVQLLNITGNFLTGPKLTSSRGFYKERMKFWIDSDIFENIGLK